jgi:hypothetical protein
MKIATFNKLALSVLVLGAAVLAPVRADDDEETPLGEEMGGISDSLKGLRRAEGWEAKVKLAREAQDNCLNALQYLPKTFEAIKDEKEKAKAQADFKRLIGTAYAALCQLEAAFLAEDEAAVGVAMDAIKAIKKEGHDKYTEDD